MLDYFGKLNKNVIDQIKYRETIITGEIKTDNEDGTYGVEISQSGKTYPNVETAHYGDIFTVGEIAIITYEYGNKEMPRIWGHAKKIAQDPKIVEVDYSGGARVETLNAYSITLVAAYLNGKISITGVIGNCTRRGFHYGTTTDYGLNKSEDGSFGEGTYNLQIIELNAGETYHYQAFVLDADGNEQVGEDKIFTTNELGRVYSLIVTTPDELQLFDMDGNLLKQLAVTGWSYAEGGTTVDVEGNVYIKEYNVIKKYDSNLNLLVTQEIESGDNTFIAINVGPDGYIYTLELIDKGYDVKKRSSVDLTIQEVIPITDEIYYSYDGPICLDSDGNIYVFNDPYIEKFSNAGVLLAQLETDGLSNSFAGCGVVSSNVYFVKSSNKIYYAPLDLSSYTQWNLPSAEAYALTVADGKLILSGWDGDGDGATTQYNSDRNLVLQIKLAAADYAYKAGGYNF